MTDRELMQQALDVLRAWQGMHPYTTANAARTPVIEALRARLEQNEFNPDWDAMAVMVEEQQRMAKRIEELEARRAQPEREWQEMTNCPDCERYKESAKNWRHKAYELSGHPLPWERGDTWVGLTDEEVHNIISDKPLNIVRAIEAKLKEKNNG